MLFKTDWCSVDYFNIDDYNRIIENIEQLKTLAQKYYLLVDIQEMEVATLSTIPTVGLVNVVETNLDRLADISNTLGYVQGTKLPFGGGKAWSYIDLNRIENNLKSIYTTLNSTLNGVKTIKFELGGGLIG